MSIDPTIKRLALVVGGGPAPGINGVISAVTIEACNRGIEVFGIEDGYKWLANGESMKALNDGITQRGRSDDLHWLIRNNSEINPTHIVRLSKEDVKQIHYRGGSLLRTSRTNPAKKKEDMANVIEVCKRMRFDAIVSIGGDDTAYTASQVYEAYKESGAYIRVAHVPKTIDNDLPLPGSTPTFGFETARHYGAAVARNLAEDARTTSRWYLVVSMGRAAGHLALGVGKAAAATLTIIPEEFGLDPETKKPKSIKIKQLTDILVGAMIKRHAHNRPYGVIVLAEGLIESIKDELKIILDNTGGKYGTYETDDFGHLRLGEIGVGNLLRDLLNERLVKPKSAKAARLHEMLGYAIEPAGISTTLVSKDLGYELRCADPIPFDIEYTRDLGYSAVKFLHTPQAMEFGAIIGFIDGGMKPMKFKDMLDPITKRMQTRLVNIKGEGFQVALEYMIRLEKSDFDDAKELRRLAEFINKTPEEFRKEFGYLVGA